MYVLSFQSHLGVALTLLLARWRQKILSLQGCVLVGNFGHLDLVVFLPNVFEILHIARFCYSCNNRKCSLFLQYMHQSCSEYYRIYHQTVLPRETCVLTHVRQLLWPTEKLQTHEQTHCPPPRTGYGNVLNSELKRNCDFV